MSVHYAAVIASHSLGLAGFNELELPSRMIAHVADEVATLESALVDVRRQASEFCVLIYDDRVGYREARVMRDDQEVVFGENEELWVPVDESGLPINSTAPMQLDDLTDDKEYETMKDAIQLGLDEFGVDISSRELLRLLTQ